MGVLKDMILPSTKLFEREFDVGQIADDLGEQGWSVCKKFLPEKAVTSLAQEAKELWHAGMFRQAAVGLSNEREVRPETRSDHILWLDPLNLSQPQKIYWDAIHRLRLALNELLFLGLNDFEGHLGVYLPGAFYKKHLDQFKRVKSRLISCILYLNSFWGESDGGHLRIYPEKTSEFFVDITPGAGTFVCFRSDIIYHEVLPSRRDRFSLTGWLKKSSFV